MNNNRLKIGEFSRLCRVTVRTLRHYEQIGLLVPEIVDRWTGYRYYTFGQFQKMQSILTLKELGYSLEEIRVCESELKRLGKRRRMLKAMIAFRKKLKKWNRFTLNHCLQSPLQAIAQ